MTRLTRQAALGLAMAALGLGCPDAPAPLSHESSALGGVQVTYFHAGLGAGTELYTDGAGAVTIERVHEPFGALLLGADAGREPLGGLGKPVDPATSLSDHGVRWFASESARWLTVDPIVRAPSPRFASAPWDANPYQYARWQPTLYWDPDGRDLRIRGARAGDLVEVLAQATGLELGRSRDGTVSIQGSRPGGAWRAAIALTTVMTSNVRTYVEAKNSDPFVLVGRPHAHATAPGQYEVDVADLDQLAKVIDPKLAQSAAIHEVFEAYLEGKQRTFAGQPARHAAVLGLETVVLAGLHSNLARVSESNTDDGLGGGVYRAELGSCALEVPFDANGHGAFRKTTP
jgi:RHS repeat-associated protein